MTHFLLYDDMGITKEKEPDREKRQNGENRNETDFCLHKPETRIFLSKTGLDMHPNLWKVLHFSEDAPKRGGSCKIQ